MSYVTKINGTYAEWLKNQCRWNGIEEMNKLKRKKNDQKQKKEQS